MVTDITKELQNRHNSSFSLTMWKFHYLQKLITNFFVMKVWGLRHLVVVSLAVSKTFPLIMTVSQERLLTFGTDKMLQTHKHTSCQYLQIYHLKGLGSIKFLKIIHSLRLHLIKKYIVKIVILWNIIHFYMQKYSMFPIIKYLTITCLAEYNCTLLSYNLSEKGVEETCENGCWYIKEQYSFEALCGFTVISINFMHSAE